MNIPVRRNVKCAVISFENRPRPWHAKTPTRSNTTVRSMLFLVKKLLFFTVFERQCYCSGRHTAAKCYYCNNAVPTHKPLCYFRLRARSRTRQFRANGFFSKVNVTPVVPTGSFSPFLGVSIAIPSTLLVLGFHYFFPISFQSVYLETSTLIFFSSVSVQRNPYSVNERI